MNLWVRRGKSRARILHTSVRSGDILYIGEKTIERGPFRVVCDPIPYHDAVIIHVCRINQPEVYEDLVFRRAK